MLAGLGVGRAGEKDSAGGPRTLHKHLREKSLGHTWLYAPGAPRSLAPGHVASFPPIRSLCYPPPGNKSREQSQAGFESHLSSHLPRLCSGPGLVLSRREGGGAPGGGVTAQGWSSRAVSAPSLSEQLRMSSAPASSPQALTLQADEGPPRCIGLRGRSKRHRIQHAVGCAHQPPSWPSSAWCHPPRESPPRNTPSREATEALNSSRHLQGWPYPNSPGIG